MPDELDFDSMIATMEVKVSALQEAISALRKAKDALAASGLSVTGASADRIEIAPDEFTGLTIAEAAHKYLKKVGRPARTTEAIVDALTRGGLQRISPASVSTILFRGHNADAPVVRIQKGLWGLAEWYPKRPPKITRSLKDVPDLEEAEEQSVQQDQIDDMIEHNKERRGP
jgi:hypothetical protein